MDMYKDGDKGIGVVTVLVKRALDKRSMSVKVGVVIGGERGMRSEAVRDAVQRKVLGAFKANYPDVDLEVSSRIDVKNCDDFLMF